MNMKRWIFFVLIVAGLTLSACAPASTTTEKVKPFELEPIEGTDFKRVILTEKAAERLDIQTAVVGDEQVGRNQLANGVVIASPELTTMITAPTSGTVLAPIGAAIPVTGAQLSTGQTVFRLSSFTGVSTDQSSVELTVPSDTILLRLHVSPGQFVEAGQPLFEVADVSKVWVRVPLTEAEFSMVDHSQGANILMLQGDDADEGLEAEAVEEPGDVENDADEAGDVDFAVYYGLDNPNKSLALGQHVQVKLTLSGSATPRKVIPYAAVIYDTEGNTWVYTNPEPLVFVRQPIVVDYFAGDSAVLSEGPESGTAVVIVGGSELLGTELGVSK